MRWVLFILVITCLACNHTPTNTPSTNSDNLAERYKQSQQPEIDLKHRINLLKEVLQQAQTTDTISTYALYSLSSSYYRLKKYDSMRHYGSMLLDKRKSTTTLVNIGKYYHLIGFYHEKVTSKFDSAYHYHDLAKRYFLQSGDSARAFGRIVRLGYLQRFQGDYFGAKETLTDALLLQKGSTDNNKSANLFNELGIVNMELGNLDEAQNFYTKAVSRTESDIDRLIYMNNYGVSLMEANQQLRAKKIFQEILADSLIQTDSVQLARVTQNLGYALWKNNEPQVLPLYEKAHKISAQINDINGLIFSHRRFGEYHAVQAPSEAIDHLTKSLQLAKRIKRPRLELDALELLTGIAPNNLQFKNRLIGLKDSLYDQELKVKTQFAYLKYQDQQEKEQLLRLEAEKAKQEAQLARQETQKLLFISIGVFLLILGALLYHFLQQRHKREKLNVVYNTEKRISQDLHDGLANDIFGLITQVQGQQKNDIELLNKLETIYQASRRASHENAALKTGHEFETELNSLINTYQYNGTTIITKGMGEINWSRMNDHKCIVVHRSLKELLVNMKKHSKASLVLLKFEGENGKLRITYSDNGIGINPNIPKGIGIMNTENRIKAVGGTFTFEPEMGKGAKAKISIPF